ncbi:MAG: dihydroxy-acid dehydratase, partial [Myxococcales bacterium]|nr:dihydroxy-acid dehydratase [Myxococcales bacterium]
HVSPEAAAGGPIAALRDGDLIDIDLDARTLNVRLDDATLAERLKTTPRRDPPAIGSRWLRRYASLVQSASTGATLRTP